MTERCTVEDHMGFDPHDGRGVTYAADPVAPPACRHCGQSRGYGFAGLCLACYVAQADYLAPMPSVRERFFGRRPW